MPVTTLEPNTHVKIRFRPPRNGRIDYAVEAEAAVNSYIMDKDGLANYYAGEEFSTYGGLLRRRYHNVENLPLDPGWWYLIIENDSDKPVAISYHLDAS